ncbi:hypothetical protein Dimus_011945 [Dionaea muscipula]
MTNSKVEKAITAMKALGIPQETVKPVLKKLFNLYDRSWDFIEAENYRALADAIFECKEDKGVKVKREKTMDDERSEPSCKKLCTEQEENDASSMMVIDKQGSILPSSVDAVSTVPPQSQSSGERRPKHCSQLTRMGPLEKRHDNNAYVVKQTSGRAPSSTSTKLEGKIPRAKQNADSHDAGSSHLMMTSKRIVSAHPQLPGSFSLADISIKSGSCSLDKENQEYGSESHSSSDTYNKFNIVSSSLGSVKLSFYCDSSIEQLNFHALNQDAVLKFMEERLHKHQDIVGPPFCLKMLLEEMCECFLELVSDSSQGRAAAKSFQVIKRDPQLHSVRSSTEVSGVGRSGDVPIEQEIEILAYQKKPRYYIEDISKGEEKMKISLVDENGKGDRPSFYYIPKNLIYQNAHVNISLARISDDDCCPSCSNDCLSAPVPCACARETGGEFAYTPEGLLKEEFLRTCISMNEEPEKHHLFYCPDCPVKRSKDESCRGHLIRKFVKECWSKCGCDLHCGNRVVQRGINRNLQVFWTDDRKGWGLQALEDLPVGAFVCEYVGEVLTNTELYERNLESSGNARHTYPVQLDADWGSESILQDEELLCLDATYYGNVARFINHRCCDSNLIEIPVEVETLDHHYYHLAFFTKRKVKAFEELTWDYQIDFDDHDHPIKAFQCCCQSAFCRDKSRKAKGKAKASR